MFARLIRHRFFAQPPEDVQKEPFVVVLLNWVGGKERACGQVGYSALAVAAHEGHRLGR